MGTKMPCYPLVTIDPLMSIWSKTRKLNESDTMLWCGIKKRILGTVIVDGKALRFMGLGNEPAIEQTDVTVTPSATCYTFENESIRLTVKFWSPNNVDDLYELSMPCSFIECTAVSIDGDAHRVLVKISLDKELCYDRIAKPIVRKAIDQNGLTYAVMGRKSKNRSAKAETAFQQTGDIFAFSAKAYRQALSLKTAYPPRARQRTHAALLLLTTILKALNT